MHVEPAPQDTEHDPVHCTAHVEPAAQLTLPLGPTVTSHSAPVVQLMLHDAPHEPVQVDSAGQLRVQLSPLQAESPMSQAVPASHVHELPVQLGGGGPSSPHATNSSMEAHTWSAISGRLGM